MSKIEVERLPVVVKGRPTKYDNTIVFKTLSYIDQCVDEIEEFHKTRGEKSDSYDRHVRVKIPTIEGLSLHLGVNKDSLYKWEKEYTAFSDVMTKLRSRQAQALIEGGLSGDYNAMIAKVLLTKHGYRDSNEVVGKDGKDFFQGLLDSDREKLDALE